nr:MAG TPA: hypothetical protein [Caudoviricetes sp.]
MIDFGKIQADAVKNICKSKITRKAGDYRIYGVIAIDGNEYIPLMYKGISIYLIPEKYYLLSQALVEVGNPMVENIFKSAETADQLTDTKVIKILSDGRQLKEFKSPFGKPVFVDEKLIKPFGQGLRYYAGENSDIVYIKEVDEWLGLAFATRVKENEQ